MCIISSDGKTMGDYSEVDRRYTNIIGWSKLDGRFTILCEFSTDSLAQSRFEDYIQVFRKATDKNNFIYQIISVDKYNPIAYN